MLDMLLTMNDKKNSKSSLIIQRNGKQHISYMKYTIGN